MKVNSILIFLSIILIGSLGIYFLYVNDKNRANQLESGTLSLPIYPGSEQSPEEKSVVLKDPSGRPGASISRYYIPGDVPLTTIEEWFSKNYAEAGFIRDTSRLDDLVFRSNNSEVTQWIFCTLADGASIFQGKATCKDSGGSRYEIRISYRSLK